MPYCDLHNQKGVLYNVGLYTSCNGSGSHLHVRSLLVRDFKVQPGKLMLLRGGAFARKGDVAPLEWTASSSSSRIAALRAHGRHVGMVYIYHVAMVYTYVDTIWPKVRAWGLIGCR